MKSYIFLIITYHVVSIMAGGIGWRYPPTTTRKTTTKRTTTTSTTTTSTQAHVLYPNPSCPSQDYDFTCVNCDNVRPSCNSDRDCASGAACCKQTCGPANCNKCETKCSNISAQISSCTHGYKCYYEQQFLYGCYICKCLPAVCAYNDDDIGTNRVTSAYVYCPTGSPGSTGRATCKILKSLTCGSLERIYGQYCVPDYSWVCN